MKNRSNGQSPGDTRPKHSFGLSQQSCVDSVYLPAMMCVSIYGVLLTRQGHLSLDVQGFYCELVILAWLTTCVDDLSLYPLRGQSDITWFKSPTINRLLVQTIQSEQSKQRHCHQTGYSKGLEVTYQELNKACVFLGMCSMWEAQTCCPLCTAWTLIKVHFLCLINLKIRQNNYSHLISFSNFFQLFWFLCFPHIFQNDFVSIKYLAGILIGIVLIISTFGEN